MPAIYACPITLNAPCIWKDGMLQLSLQVQTTKRKCLDDMDKWGFSSKLDQQGWW